MPLMRTPEGVVVDVPIDQAQRALDVGYRPVTPAQAAPALTQPDTNDSALLAGTTGLLSGATLGLSDAAIAALGTQGDIRAVREARAAHPILTGGAELAGAIAPAFLTGGESLPSSLAARAGAGVTEAAGGGLAGALIGGAAEGAIFGAGQGVSDLALSQDPLTIERIGSTLSSDVIYGAGFGAGIGGAGALLGRGLRSAKGAIDDFIEKRAAQDAIAATPDAIATADVATLDRRGLAKAEEAEVARIEAERAPQKQNLISDLDTFRDEVRDAKLYKLTYGTADADIREAGASLRKAEFSLRGALDNKAALAREPQKIAGLLERQEQALSEIRKWGQDELSAAEDAHLWRQKVVERVRAGQEDYAPIPSALTEQGVQNAADAIMRKNGLRVPSEFDVPKLKQIAEEFTPAIDTNRALQQRIKELIADPTSERLTAIAQAREALGLPAQPSLSKLAFHAAARWAGPVGAIAETGAGLFGGIKKAAGAAAERSGKAASAFLDVAATGADNAALATPLATKLLAGLRYTAERTRRREDDEVPSQEELPELYRKRTDEIKRLTEYDETGVPKMRAAAREQLAAKLQPIGVFDPSLADRLESYAARRVAYLSSIMPRRPDVAGIQVGPDHWHPSDMEMRSWARSAAAVEDPHGVLERALHGQITPEDVGAMQAVHPEILRDWTEQVAAALPTLRATLPYHRRLALSILTGEAVDPALDPHVLALLQGQFPAEPGSAGGTQAPRGAPQFGSIKKLAHDSLTPAQERRSS